MKYIAFKVVVCIPLCFVFLLPAAHGQPSHTETTVELSLNAGYMMPNNRAYSHFSRPTFGFDATYWYRSFDNSYWRWKRGYPSIGYRLSYARIPHSVAGDRFGVVNLIGNQLTNWLDFSIGLGLSAYTRPRSLTGDTNNIFIGSLINCLIDVGLTARYSDNLYLSLRILHTSNGMLVWPNMGLNYLQVDMGYRLPISRTQQGKNISETPLPEKHPSREWGAALSLGTVMSRDREFTGYYPCYDLSFHYQRYVSPLCAVGGTVDFWYNYVDRKHLDREEGVYTLPIYLSAMGGIELFWGAMSLKAGVGTVIVSSPQVTIPIYERIGGYYNFGKNYIGVALNAHIGRIEFIEWTFGHRFPIP